MATVHRSRFAEEDYDDIWLHIARDNPNAADALIRSIDAKLELYALQPRMGTKRDDLAPGLRSFPVGSYMIFYRIVSDGIQLVRALHGNRDVKSLLMHEGRGDQSNP